VNPVDSFDATALAALLPKPTGEVADSLPILAEMWARAAEEWR
jgi:hypothetical protein